MRGRHAAPPRWQARLQPILPPARNGQANQAAQTRDRSAADDLPEPRRSRRVLGVRVRPTEAAALGILAVMVVFCFIGPLFYRPDLTHVNLALTNLPPSGKRPLGTDPDGIDVLGRLMTGGQLSLEVGMAAGILASIIGSLWGATAGYLGGVADAVMMRLVDAGFAIPAVVLLLLLSAVYTPSPALLILVIAATSWLSTARLVRGAALTLRTREFVQAVKTMGGGRTRTIVRHIAPNALSLIAVNVSFQIADAIVVLATLSYLGLGVQPPSSDWGDMIAAGVPLIYSGYWWEIYPAGIAIISVVIAFNLLGDALSDRLETAGRRH